MTRSTEIPVYFLKAWAIGASPRYVRKFYDRTEANAEVERMNNRDDWVAWIEERTEWIQ